MFINSPMLLSYNPLEACIFTKQRNRLSKIFMHYFFILKKRLLTFVFFLCVIMLCGCSAKEEVVISGKTMGTTWHVKIVTGYFKDTDRLKSDIETRLQAISQSMSTYRRESEISRFNALKSKVKKFFPSDDFFEVMRVAEKIYLLTNGAWDGTIEPLVNIWGFGSGRSPGTKEAPDSDEIEKILTKTGFNNIIISDKRFFLKQRAYITVDLASIAKGYAVDAVAQEIKAHGIRNFLVEIGGEVLGAGVKQNQGKWRVGINTPEKNALPNSVYKIIRLENKAMATSGDYRNFFEINGNQYSHVIDPKTGYPVQNNVVSVSIIADTCAFADGLATGVMVMGHKKGLELVNSLDNVECLIVVRTVQGLLTDYYSKGFKEFFVEH